MTIRLISQYVTFGISLFIVAISVLAMHLRPDKRWSLMAWAMYGLVNASFYVIVLFLDAGQLANDLSPVRVLIKDTLVASMIFFASLQDFRDWYMRWKIK